MITYFTTTKDFKGLADTAQENAIRSWLCSVDGAEVIIFGESLGLDRFQGQEGIILHPEIKTSQEGTPRIDDMFLKAQSFGSHSICCFINADIILTKDFPRSILSINEKTRAKYLIVGQRDDIQLNHLIDFELDWELSLKQLVEESGRRHLPTGSDFFAFPRGQYKPGDIPPLLVGRGGWDLWMIYYGRKQQFKVIDLSPTVTVIHQDHDYTHRKEIFLSYLQDAEAQKNLQHIPSGETFIYTLHACNYHFRNNELQRNYARGNLRKFLTYELNLRRDRFVFKKIRNLAKKIHLIK